MIKGRQKSWITKSEILKKINTYDIYRFYQGPFELNEVCVNRYRGEKDPSLIIGDKLSGELTHKDFGDYSWRGDAFHFVKQIFKCSFDEALERVNKDFNLGLGGGKITDKKVITWEQPEIKIKRPPLLQILHYDRMDKRHLEYWSKLCQGESDLKRENIYQVKNIWRNKKKVGINDLLVYGYYYPDIDRWKIYRPFAPKKTDKTPPSLWKWDSNIPFNYIDNLQAISSDCKRIFLEKSKKDRMVVMKALQTECVVDVQAEDPACLSEEALQRFKEIPDRWAFGDNDPKGKQFTWWLTKEHGFKHLNVPDSYLVQDPKCTDFADLCYHHGMKVVINYFKLKKLI